MFLKKKQRYNAGKAGFLLIFPFKSGDQVVNICLQKIDNRLYGIGIGSGIKIQCPPEKILRGIRHEELALRGSIAS